MTDLEAAQRMMDAMRLRPRKRLRLTRFRLQSYMKAVLVFPAEWPAEKSGAISGWRGRALALDGHNSAPACGQFLAARNGRKAHPENTVRMPPAAQAAVTKGVHGSAAGSSGSRCQAKNAPVR